MCGLRSRRHGRAPPGGGRAALSRDKPTLFVEIYGGVASNRDPEATVTTIRALGYDAFVVGASGLDPFVRHDDRRYNYFFLPSCSRRTCASRYAHSSPRACIQCGARGRTPASTANAAPTPNIITPGACFATSAIHSSCFGAPRPTHTIGGVAAKRSQSSRAWTGENSRIGGA